MAINHNEAIHLEPLTRSTLIFTLLLGLSGCFPFDLDGVNPPDCYGFASCEDDEICVKLGGDGEVKSFKDGECVSASICEDIPGLDEAIFDHYATNQPLDLVGEATELRFCEAGQALSCANDTQYFSCSRRDDFRVYPEESGCYHYFTPVRSDVEMGNKVSCEGDSVCVDDESGASCVPTCSASSACDAPQTCQLPSSMNHFICGPAQPGPLVDSVCTVTIVEALVDGSTLEGNNFNDPDLYVILSSGEFRDTTFVVGGSERPVWNYSFTDLSYELVSKMSLELVDDDEATLGFIPNLDDSVYEWFGPNNDEGWRLTSMEQSYELSGGLVSYLRVEISCQ